MKRYMSLSKIIRLFIFLFAMMLAAMLVAVNYYYYTDGQRTERWFAEQSLEESSRLLREKLQSIAAVMQNIAVDGGGSDFCTQNHAWRNANHEYLRAQLNQLALDTNIISSVTIYADDGVYISSDGENDRNPYVLYQHLNERNSLDQSFRKTLYILDIPDNAGTNAMLYITEPIWDQLTSRFSLQRFRGIMVTQVKIANLLNHVNVTAQPLWVRDASDLMINSLGNTDLFSQIPDLLSRAVSGCGLTLCRTNEVYDTSGSMGKIIRFSLYVGILMVLLHTAFMLVFRRMIVRPIEQLAQSVSHFAAGNIQVPGDISNRNELILLTHSINDMLDRIRKNNEEQTRRLRERAIFMQARINPHFLYNNLECIRGMAAMSEYESIRELTGVMADIYRYCNHAAPCASLNEEITCAEKYFCLMSLRYPKRLSLQIDVSEDAKELMLPRMCLQPLMENSIRHGILAAMREKGSLSITAYATQDALWVVLTDDGCGMDEEAYARLNQNDTVMDCDSHHISVKNVRGRLHILFGEKASLIFSPAETGGVRAVLSVPKTQNNY